MQKHVVAALELLVLQLVVAKYIFLGEHAECHLHSELKKVALRCSLVAGIHASPLGDAPKQELHLHAH